VPSAPTRYLASALLYALDTVLLVNSWTGGKLKPNEVLKKVEFGSCLAKFAGMGQIEIDNGAEAARYLNDAMGTMFGYFEDSLDEILGPGLLSAPLIAGLSWLFSGVLTALNGFGAAADTALDPDGYQIRILVPNSFIPSELLSARAPAMCRHPSGRLVNGELPNRPVRSGFVVLRMGGVRSYDGDPITPVLADLTGDGQPETTAVFLCSAGGVSWPNVIAVYGPGGALVDHIDLIDHSRRVDAEHADVTSLRANGRQLRVEWMTYQGWCLEKRYWRGVLKLDRAGFQLTEQER
jgi:hypothetical protein